MYTHIFIQAPERRQNRLGLQKVDPVTNAKGLAPGQLDMYTWQLYQGLWQRSDWLECPQVHQSIQRIITFLFYVNTFLVGPQIEGTEIANFDPVPNAKGLARAS